MYALFDGDTCRACPMLATCCARAASHGKKGTPASEGRCDFLLDVSPRLIARDQRFVEQNTQPWRERYAIRSGIEATNSELKRAHGLGKLRVRKRPRVLFAIASKIIACNIKRWLRTLADAGLDATRVALTLLYTRFLVNSLGEICDSRC